jgi:hypothetical protein
MSSGWDEVENDMNSSILELGITLNTRLLGKESLVLVLNVLQDLDESLRVVDIVSKSRGVNHGQDDLLSISLNV